MKRLRSIVHAGDLVAGFSTALVLIPQALAYALLAGMPARHGLYVAVLAPLAAALIGSSPYLGTGPTALASLLTFGALTALATPGGPDYIALAALLALLVGAIRIVLGLLHGGFIAYLMSQPLVTGFTTGAAVVIVSSQVPTVLGTGAEGENPVWRALDALSSTGEWSAESIAVALGVAAIVVVGRRIHRLFPGILVAVVAAIAYGAWTTYPGAVVGTVNAGLPPFSLALPWSQAPLLLAPAAVLAVIGFSEASSIARHYATLERRSWDSNRELIGQGLANVAVGVAGGFPASGSFSRSALMRDAGARTRMAGVFTGLIVLLTLPFTSVLSDLPTAGLAAIIIVAVKDLIRVGPFLEYLRYARLQASVALATFILTVVLAPHVERAVLIGVVLAVGAHLWRELRLSIPAWTSNGTLHLAPKGVLYFASAPGLEGAFGRLLHAHPEARRLVIHLDGLGRIDLTGALVLRSLLNDARDAGLEAHLEDVPPPAQKIVARVIEGRTDI